MKLTLKICAVVGTAVALAGAAQTEAAAPKSIAEIFKDEDCIGKHKDENSCNKDDACVWCKAQAIPSECLTLDQAKMVPPGVFQCDSKNAAAHAVSKHDGFLDIKRDTGASESVAVSAESKMAASMGLRAGGARMERKLLNASLVADDGEENFCDPNVRQATGYFRLKDANKHYFFWFFESRNDPANDPVILWLTGGPGCSSSLALFVENGPCKVKSDGSGTELNPYSWNANASVIFVDSPPGTGWSYGTPDFSEKTVGKDLNSFLRVFFEKFDSFIDRDFFIFAESYGGKWAPHTATAVNEANKALIDGEKPIKLKGVAIGNGLTNPEEQVRWYADMAYNSGTAPSRISKAEYLLLKNVATPVAYAATKACNMIGTFPVCQAAQQAWTMGLMLPYAATGYNQYDMRIECEVPGLCYNFTVVSDFLNRDDVQEILGVDKAWTECDRTTALEFAGQEMRNVDYLIPELLEDGIDVMLYVGDCDYICNWIGNKAWAVKMDWPGKDEFANAADEDYTFEGKSVGKLRSHREQATAGAFSFLQLHEAGHMVPLDQPEVALHMVRQFTIRT
ncbi:Carboxypeptidase Y [Hondaea fermentalgiana]|uniref:Carboxypeptidase n=1 Tax=Hondaea fermentalgiana TaxID=2315210 RepID=A0A2R5GN04_9STRA|nr:Carboxypeptidase Y [Hondaea fermentalgiana]|eukprot:GBG32282.1 Carboxypeptidase Y [Hondaea fermentalgiana]